MNKIPCTVTILTLNNEDTIEQCLRSVSLFDDIVVLDGNSTDRTREIAAQFGARIFDQQEGAAFNTRIANFTDMRVKSFNLARYEWVCYIDSDEYIDEALAADIAEMVARNSPFEMGQFRRIAVVEGAPIEHAYYYPDWTDRLIHRRSGIAWKQGNLVHERLIIPDNVEKRHLAGKLYARWPSLAECIKKDDYYQSLTIEKLKARANEKTLADMFRGAWKNTLRAVKVFALAVYLPLRHKHVLPFRYHMRFVRYNLKHAWSMKKWRIMLTAAWERQPKLLRNLIILALIGRLLVAGSLMVLHGQDAFVYSVNGDAVEYATIAKNLVERGVFSDQTEPPFAPQSWRTPGLPLIMIPLLGGHGWFVPTILVQIIATSALVMMVWHVTAKLFGDRAAAIAAALTALEPNMLYWPSQVLTEPLFMVMLFLTVMAMLRWMEHPESSGFTGVMVLLTIATYIRQVSFFLLFVLPVIAIVWAMMRRANMKKVCASVLVGCVCAAALFAPWYYRNYRAFGVWTFDVQFAGKGSIGKYLEAYTLAKYGKPPIEQFRDALVDASGEVNYQALQSLTVKTALRDPLPFVNIGILSGIPFFTSDGWFTIAKTFNPSFEAASFDKTWDGTIDGLRAMAARYMAQGGAVFLIAKLLYALMAAGAIGGAMLALKNTHGVARAHVAVLVVVVLYAWAASGLGSYARFRYPFSPYLFMFIGYAIACLWRRREVQSTS